MKKICFLIGCLYIPFSGAGQQHKAGMPVKVHVEIGEAPRSREMILYRHDRLLTIKDFKGRPDKASPGVAATYSGILMELQGNTEEGIVQVSVRLSIYFNQAKSWMKREGRQERVLAHEQHHFDLTAIKACALAEAIAAGKYTADNVKERIKALQQQYTSELEALQQAYDRETRHGTDEAQQAAWTGRIAGWLAGVRCI